MKDCSTCFYNNTEGTMVPCASCKCYDKHAPMSSFIDHPSKVVKLAGIGLGVGTQPIGNKYDGDKPDWSLLPFTALSETVDVLTFGAKKYGPENWKLVPNAKKRYLAAAFRHIVSYATGEKKDAESGKSHLSHALCCLLFILELEKENDTNHS